MKFAVALITAAFAIALAGCSEQPASPVKSDLQMPTAEPLPAYAQELVDRYTVFDSELTGNDLGAPLFDVPVYDPNRDYDVYSITFLWGPLFNLSTNALSLTDWSGGVGASVPAAMRVRALIDFDKGQDSLLPTTDISHVRWISFTDGDFDGISLLVFVPRNILTLVIPAFYFRTEAISLQWDFEELARLDAFYPVDNMHGLAVHSRRLYTPSCRHGFMKGTWSKTEQLADGGTFEGLWLDHKGSPEGHASGQYWTTQDGERLLEGWVSGYVTDEVLYHLKGTWMYDDMRLCPMCGEGHGLFKGRIFRMDDRPIGIFVGEFGDWSLPPDDVLMPLCGFWRINCNTVDLESSRRTEGEY